MKQEFVIKNFVVDLKNPDTHVFLPEGSQILETSYEVISHDYSFVAPIGGIDKLHEFNYIKKQLKENDLTLEKLIELKNNFGMNLPMECYSGKLQMVIKALVPAPNPKGKYA